MKDSAILIQQLKDAGEDHEFYPTTNEIISFVVKDIKHENGDNYRHLGSVLDIGAGNGKVLKAIQTEFPRMDLLAIEKSPILCQEMPSDVLLVGTTFEEQSLLSKHVDVVFCNPPYSQYESWTEKIIREASSQIIYLVIPERWIKSVRIQDAIRYREAEVSTLGNFDFEDAEDRKARAKVHLLKVELKSGSRCGGEEDDAFTRFFKDQFKELFDKFEATKGNEKETRFSSERKPEFKELAVGSNYPEVLVSLYLAEMEKIQKNYALINQLDPDLMREFGIKPENVMTCLKKRLEDTKSKYWTELFSRLDAVTNKLTSSSRKNLLSTLHKHVFVDFTIDNILAILVWVIKNANKYIDDQLIETYELMVDKCNVHMYKSNQKTWVDDRWRYRETESQNSHYSLDYRIVMHRCGGIRKTDFIYDKGLEERAAEFLGDLMTLAHNLGFVSFDDARDILLQRNEWTSGRNVTFYYADGEERKKLFDVKAFLNGNMHIRVCPDFMLALNVEHGRLKGWIKNPKEAVEELQDEKAAQYFNSCKKILSADPRPLLGSGR
jgi:predicted RNA methylase